MEVRCLSVKKKAAIYSLSNLLTQVSMFLSNFLMRRILAPEIMGFWNLSQVVRGYLLPVNLGATSGAFRELPILHGKGNEERVVEIQSMTFWITLFEVLLVDVCLFGYVYYNRVTLGHVEVVVLLTTAFLMIGIRLQDALLTFFQGAQLYVPLSHTSMVSGFLYAALLVLGAYVWGINGVLIGAMLGETVRTWLYVRQGRLFGIKIHLFWSWKEFKELASYGIAMRVADYPSIIFTMFDLFWVTKMLGLRDLGIYALARSIYGQASDVTVKVGNVFYTRTLKQYGEGVSRLKIFGDMRRFIMFQVLISVPIVCFFVAVVTPILIRAVTPLYIESIPITLILVVGSFFLSTNNNLFAVWIAERRLFAYGMSNVFGVLTTGGFILFFWYILEWRSLQNIALASVCGLFCYYTYMIFVVGRELWGWKSAANVFLMTLMAGGWTAASIFTFYRNYPSEVAWSSTIMNAILNAVAMFGMMSPLVIFGLWITGGGRILLNAITNFEPARKLLRVQ